MQHLHLLAWSVFARVHRLFCLHADALAISSGIARSWTEQMGYPVIQASSSAAAGKVTLSVSQAWFMGDGSLVTPEEQKTWQLPLLISSKSNPEPKLYTFDSSSAEIVVEGAQAGDWINVNAGHVTPARVEYSPELLEALKTAVR